MFKSNKNGRGRLQTRLLKTLKLGLVGLLLTVPFLAYHQQHVEGAPSSTLNFQARLLGGSGAIVPDGFYNVQFKLYNVNTGGSVLWTDTRYDSNGVTAGNDFRLSVKNGYLSVYLADTSAGGTAFPSTINWNEEHWLTMNIGGATQTATPTWDGEMNPRIKLTAVPYAFQAGELAKTSGANRGKLYFDTVANAPDIKLPDASGTLCLQGASACGFAAGSGDADYIQNTTTQQTNTNFNIFASSGVAATIQGASGQNILVLNVNGGSSALTVASTGNVTLVADLAVNGGDITSSGTLNVTPGGAMTLGATGQTATLQGSTTTITSTGAGNDITLTSADMIVLNPASTGGVDINGVMAVGNNQTVHSQYVLRLAHIFDNTSACGFFGCFGTQSNITIDNPTSPTTATAISGQVSVINNTALTTAYSLFAGGASVQAGSSITNNYGLYVGIQTGGTTDYGIYSQGADDYGIYLDYGQAFGSSTPNYGLYIKNADTYAIHVDDGATRLDGTLEVGTLGATDTNAVLCRNAAKQLADCSSTFLTSATGFVQNGNSFGATAVLGTNDAQNLAFETAGTTRLTLDQSGNAALTGNLSVAVAGDDGVEILGADAAYEDHPSLTFGPGSSKPWTIVPGGASNSLEVYGQSSVVGAFLLGGGFRVGNTDTGNPLMMPNASSSNPAYVFNNEDDTGMYLAGTNALGFSTGGTTRLTLGATGDATFSGNLVVQGTGTSSFAGTVTVAGDATLGNANTDTLTITGTAVMLPNNLNFDSNTLFIDASNNRVGIGNITPGAALEVTGDIYLTKEANRTIKVANSTTSTVVGGALSLLGGDGNNSFGGAVTIKGGAGAGTGVQVGGAVNILGGDSVGFVTGSNVNITAGGGLVGGQVKINGGVGFGTSGHIILQDSDPNGSVGIGTTAPDARLELGGNKLQSAWGFNGVQLQASSATYTDSSTAASGTATNAAINSFGIGTIAASNANVTVTNAATVYIQGAPTNGANVNVIPNSYALWVDAGTARFDGTIDAQGGAITSTGVALAVTGGTTLSLQSTGANAVSLDSGTTGGINIGTGTGSAKTIQIGTTSTNTGITQTIGVGNLNAAGTTNITIGTGTSATAGTTTVQAKGVLSLTGTGGITATGAAASSLTTSAGGLTLTGAAASTWSTSAGALTLTSAATAVWSVGGTNQDLTLQTSGTGTVAIQAAGAGTVAIGNNAQNSTVNIGHTGSTVNTSTVNIATTSGNSTQTVNIGSSGSANNSITLESGSAGSIQIGNGATVHGIQIGTGAAAQTITMGSTNSTSTTTMQAGTGGIALLSTVIAKTTTDGANIFQLQNSVGATLFSLDSTQTTNLATNGGAETPGTFSTNWTAQGGAAAPSRTTTSGQYASGTAGVAQATTAIGHGVRNNLGAALTAQTTYVVSFSVKTTVALSNANMVVEYYRTNAPLLDATCTSFTQASISTSNFIKYTCTFQTSVTGGNTTAYLAIRQSDGTSRTVYVDNLSIVAQNNTGTQDTNVLRVGGPTSQGLTLLTLDTYAGTPFTGASSALAGSMYYDTTAGKIQCYDGTNWGACGAAPNNIVTLTPEYAGAVLNGGSTPGIGTLTSDFCSSGAALTVGTLCASGEVRNFYKWTSPQSTLQTYSIYVNYKLPATFEGFLDANTMKLTWLTDSATGTNGKVTYQVYRKASGGGVTSCDGSTESTVASPSANVWNTTQFNGDETACSFAAGDYVIFKINVKSMNNANVYVENLDFTYTNQ